MDDTVLRNRTFDELTVGDAASLVRIVGQDDINLFAAVSGDVNPAHLDAVFASTDLCLDISWLMACGRAHCFPRCSARNCRGQARSISDSVRRSGLCFWTPAAPTRRARRC